ncbi:MAG TPA: tRNA (adenosine(37)-N6)-dimethylallyltransferase MiaA [Gemmatimonadaceae bacterium]|nr:tRNA (adenosine(37)-N6)-dimethylallyltransferase MiaA [Gemmatimonadaceae bacterium]
MAANRIRVICGPTAAGKSAIAGNLALEYGATIISADSRQIYRGFDIGTAKPSWNERKAIRHVGIDVAEPTERFSASAWATMAIDWIDEVIAGGSIPLIVGGTGFYIRALFDPLFAAPELDQSKREQLEHILNPMTLSELRRWCSELDPERSHLGRYQLVRAIEIALLTGRRISALHAADDSTPVFAASYLLVDPGPALAERIERRVDEMIDAGWETEVRSLDASVPEHAPAWKASGYGVMRSLSRGEIDLSVARERIIIETRQYAKRQRTWFRHQLGDAPVTRVNPDDPDAQAIAQRWWKETS